MVDTAAAAPAAGAAAARSSAGARAAAEAAGASSLPPPVVISAKAPAGVATLISSTDPGLLPPPSGAVSSSPSSLSLSSSRVSSRSPSRRRRRRRLRPEDAEEDGAGVMSSGMGATGDGGCLRDTCEACDTCLPPPVEDADDSSSVRLAELGYKQELFRGFDAFMAFSLDFSCFSPITSISVLYRFSLTRGGPPVMLGSWLVTWAMTVVCALVLGEICSTYPLAGSVYSWAGELCAAEWAPFWSYWTGWFNLLGYLSGVAAFAYIFADTLSAAESVGALGRELTGPEMVGVAIAVLAAWALLNLLRIDHQGWLQNFGALWQMATTIAIVVAILITPSPEHRNNARNVFEHLNNDSGFPDRMMPYVCILGFLPALFGFSGYDGSAHMSEETMHASTSAPRSMIFTVLGGGAIGLVYILGLAFATADIPKVLATTATHDAAVATFFVACGPRVGRVLARLLVSNVFFGGLAQLTVTVRTAFAMARDRAFPGWRWLRKVNPTLKAPLRLLGACCALDALLLLLALLTPTAFYTITSISAVGVQISYTIPCLQRATVARKTFEPSEFHLGRSSLPCAWTASLWLALTNVVFLLPLAYPINARDFNYASAMVLGTMLLGTLDWWLRARHSFVGPNRLPFEHEEGEEGIGHGGMWKGFGGEGKAEEEKTVGESFRSSNGGGELEMLTSGMHG